MGKNNSLRSMTPKNKNYKLYKAKKQWITACATFMLAFGATAVVNASVQADTTMPVSAQTGAATDNSATATEKDEVISAESAQPQSAVAEATSNADVTKDIVNASAAAKINDQGNTTDQLKAANAQNVGALTASLATATTTEENNTATTINGGYDSATWGMLDTSQWTGQNTTFDGTSYYQLTGYTGDTTHIIVPNEADFAAAGTSTNGLQVAISNGLLNQWKNATTIAFSKTEDKKVKLASTNLNTTFQNAKSLTNLDANSLDTSSVTSMQSTFDNASRLSSLTGISDWDVSNVTNMSALFQNATGLTSLTGLENWNVQKVTNMTRIFNNINKITDLSPLSNWKTSSLQSLNTAFANNSYTNLHGLENWDVSHVTNMGVIFMSNANLTDISALSNWDTSNVTDINRAFNVNQALTTLHGLENWNTSKVTNMTATFANEGSLVDASAVANWNTSNVTNMTALFQGSNAQYVDLSKWDFSKVTSASSVINNKKTVIYLGNNSTITADKLNTLGLGNFANFNQPIILASGALYTLLSGKNSNTHTITINNSNGKQLTTISAPVVYDASSASNMTDAITSYKDMVDQKLKDYITENNYVIRKVSTDPTNDVTGHNNHLVNYATATYQVVTLPSDQERVIDAGNKTIYKGATLTANDLVINSTDFPAGTSFKFADNSEPNWNKLGTYDVKITATYQVAVNGQQYIAVTTPATAKVTVTDQMQFTIIFWDDTENKELKQYTWEKAPNGGWNMISFPGINTGNYQSVGVSGVPDDVIFAGDRWVPFSNPNCNWAIPNVLWLTTNNLEDFNQRLNAIGKPEHAAITSEEANKIAGSLYGANMTVHLVHKTQDVTNTDPDAHETRTAVADFVKVNEEGTPEAKPFDSATLDVYYTRQATKDLVTGKVTYGDWKLNTSKGTNGLQVVSGSWNLPTNSSSDITVNAPDAPDGYVKVDTQVDGQLTTNFGTSANISSKLTTYYVPNSLIEKTVNRVINITPPNQPGQPSVTQTTTQSATLTRPVRVNADDSGVVFDGFTGSGWTTGQWGQFRNITSPNNYTRIIKQVVTNPDGTTTETTLNIPFPRPIPAQTVNGDTPDTVINITYTTVATATLSGTNESTYTGSSITLNDLNNGNGPGDDPIYVTVTGPTANLYSLQAGDVEFSSDNGQTWSIALPTNAGTYELRWTVQGKQNIIKAYGNNSIKWEEDGQSTITGTATYIINPKPITNVTVTGNQSKTYNGQEASVDVTGLTISGNGTIANELLSMTGITASDFEWYDANGTKLDSAPINAGIYELRLKSSALQTLQAANPNYSFDTVSGTIKYTITAAENTVSVGGTQTETYTGQPINVNYNPNGDNSVQVSISAKDGATASLNNVQLASSDFQIVDVSGNPITATNAGGVYHIVLTDAGVKKIQQALGDNYKISQGTSFGTLVINKAQASAEFSGNHSSPYTGSPNTDYLTGFSIKLNEPNNPTYNLVAGDIEFNVNGTWTTNVPVNVGQYEVRLSQAGLNHIKEINSDNVTWPATAVSGMGTYTITPATANTELSGHNSMTYNGNAVTTADLYTDGSTIKVSINGNNIVNLPTSFTLEDGDYTWNTQDGKDPVNAGKYTLTLSAAGLKKIQAAIDTAVGQDNVILSNDNTGSATFQITQAISPDVQLNGSQKSEYNGQAVSFDPANEETKKNFGFNNVQGLTIPDLTADDFEWVDQDGNQIAAPTDAGHYYLQLNEKGKKAFATANPNYTFVKDGNSTISGRITYQIYPANLIIGVTGTASEVYNGQNAAIVQMQINNGDIKLLWGNSTDLPVGLGNFTLTPDALEVVDAAGNPVSHANAEANDKTGNPVYYVRLTAAGLNKIKNLTGASNYNISLGGTTGNFLIYARKAQVTLIGNQTTTYGTELALDPTAYHIELTNWTDSSVPVPTDAEIIKAIGGLQSGDVYINGFTNGQMPVNVGTYQVKIAEQLLTRLKAAFPDYDWDAVSGTTDSTRNSASAKDIVDAEHEPATYVITPANTTVTINGAEHIKYGEASTIQYGGDNGYSITITAPVKNATTDNEHEPIYTNVTLETGDLEFVTTPGNVGTYEVKLSAQGLQKLQNLTGATNYNWTQSSAARANFFVDQMPVTITVGGDEQTVTYGSKEWLTDIKKNPQNYTLTVTTENGTALQYQAKDGDLIFSQTPGNVGSYQVVLSDAGLTNIKNALGTNYAYPQVAADVTTHGSFIVSQGEATISLNNQDGSDSKTYDGKATTPADLNTSTYDLTYSATVYAPDGTAQTIQLTTADLQFANGDPINAGSYTVELSPAGQAKLKNLTGNNGDNYKWTFNTTATYTINAATDASASLSGSNQKVFDGTAVTTAEINNGGDIVVNLTFPGSTKDSIYHLQAGDYTWANGNAPTNAGTYTIELTSAGLAHLQAAIDQYAGKGNVIISANNVTGSAIFEIVPKPITDVTISGKGQEKTYNGQEASLDVNDLSINGNDLVANTPLSRKDITASDFDWYDANGNKIATVPTNAGVYEVRLKSSALQALQTTNPNYSFNSASGMINYTINQKAATDTLSGNGEKVYNGQGTTASDVLNSITWTPSGLVDGQSLDLAALTEADYAWYTKNADGTYAEMTGLPTDTGTYYLKLKDSSIAKIQAANPNYSFAAGAISGEYTYVIKQAPASGVLTGTNSCAYNGQATTTAEVNSNGQIEVTVSFPGVTDANKTYLLKDGDYTWNTLDGSAPTNVGEYTITLTNDGISNIKNYIIGLAGRGQNDLSNVAFADDAFTGSASYTINKAEATVTISGKVEQTYNGQALNDATIYGQIVWSAHDTTNDKSFSLTHDISTSDYSWCTKNGHQYVKFTGQPVNAGTYYLILSKDYTDKLNQENPNYDFTSVNGAFTYVINKATATLNIAGSKSADYNGQPVTIDYSNFPLSITTNNGVTVDLPAGVSLGADDVISTNAAGQVVAQPTAIGTYTITLTDNGLKKFASQTDNYDWTTAGSATLSITRNANVSVILSGNEKVIYTGAVAVINPADFKITLGNGLTYELQAGDLQFVNTAAGANTNVGTYEVELSDQGRANIAKVQADNYGYDFSKEGLGTVTITKATPSAALSGDVEKSYDGAPISGYTPVVTITAPGNNSVSLTAGDYEWVKDGQTYPTAPSDAGTYTVQLTQSGIEKVKAVNAVNLDWSNVQITGSGSYTINQANALITLPATSTQTITWTGDPATIDPSNFIPEITTNNPNEKTIALPSTLQLTASDYEFLQDGKVISTPSEVGTYQVRLTQAGWQKVQNAIAGNANYTWNYQGEGNYHIEKAAAGIEIIANSADSMIYNGKPATLNADDYTLKITTNNGQTINVPLAAGDLTFSDGETPVNAGSYGVTLTQAALNKIKAEYPNYDWSNPVAGTYTINKAAADVTTSGSYDVVYNGHTPTINLAEISNKIATNNGVILLAPTLSADDYEWVDENGQAIANPVNVGTYYLKLKDTSQSKIASNDNYTWSFTGLATVTVTKANAEISFSGSQESPYTGSTVTLDPSQFAVKLSNGQTYQLTAKDIQVIGDPVNVGTYQVELSPAGIDVIKATDSNYNYQYDGSHGLLTIVPAPATATISGSQTTRDLELAPSRYTVEVNGQTITGLTANDFVFSQNGQPAQLTAAGTYEVDLSWDAINKIRQANPNYKLDFSSTATFTLENSSQTINYVDAKGNVIGSASVGGKLKGSEVDFMPEFPAGWVASEPSSVPSEIKLENGTTVIKVEHGITTVDHTKPVPVGEKAPTGELINGAHENDLNQTITRTINITMPDGKTQAITQTAKLYRDASYDDVTGEVSYSQWSTASWNEFIPAAIKGYTPSENSVPAVEVTAGQKDENINITYLANEQSGVISYRDEAGKEIGTTPISGKTGETIAVKPEAPAGWQLVSGQQLPQTVTATADGIPTVTVKVEHWTIVVTPETPEADIPTGKVPGNPSKDYQTMEQLTVTPTRTIKVKYPDGQEQSIVQKVTFTRNAIFDEVTGEIKYTDWLAQGSSQWASYQPVEVPGYVSQPKVVPAMTVNADTPAETVTITYDKIPVPQVGQEIISYQDANGQVIHTQTVTGEENTNVSFTPEVPENWQPVSELPKSVKIAGGTTVIVIEPMMVPVQEQQTVTRTIIEYLPSGDKQIVQTVHLIGTGTKNLVTGQLTDVKWDSGKFNAYTPVVVPGYTADMSIVPEVNVTVSTGDSVVEINYLPNEQTGMIIYRDESGRDISQTTLQGKTGETIAVSLAVPAGWELVPNQAIPATVMAGPDGIPDVVVLVKHRTITVEPGQTAPSGQVPGNPSATYEQMGSLTKEVTRTITVKLPDGQRQVITQAVKFTRTATFDEVTGKVAYSSWQVEGSDEWPAYTVPAINGYTASQVSVPAKMVVPDDKDQNIEIEYTKDHQPSEPNQPVTPITPDQPTTPSVPAQPAMPTKDDQLVSNKQSQIKVTDKVTSPVSNQHFVSRQLSPSSAEEKILPQTGNDSAKSSALAGLGLATLASLFGFAGYSKKRKADK